MLQDQAIQDKDILKYLTPEQVEVIHRSSHTLYRDAGDNLYRKGDDADYFFFVMNGKVSLFLSEGMPSARGEISVDEIGTGGICGLSSTFDMDSYYLTARCMEPSKVLRIEASTLRRIMQSDLLLAYTIQKFISEAYFKRYTAAMARTRAATAALKNVGYTKMDQQSPPTIN